VYGKVSIFFGTNQKFFVKNELFCLKNSIKERKILFGGAFFEKNA